MGGGQQWKAFLSVTLRFLRLHKKEVKIFAGAFGPCKSLVTPVPWLLGSAFEADGGGACGAHCAPLAAPLMEEQKDGLPTKILSGGVTNPPVH